MVARRSGYTLIELLVASVAFVAVAMLATATLSGTFRLLRVSRESHDVGVQGEIGLEAITQDMAYSSASRSVSLTDTHSYALSDDPGILPDDALLALAVPVRGADGKATSGSEVHVYCAELQGMVETPLKTISGKRLVRYVLPPGVDMSRFSAFAQGASVCTPAAIKTLFSMPSIDPLVQYLAEAPVRAVSLRFWPVWAGVPSATADANFYGVRIELAVRYAAQNVADASAPEARSSDASYLSPQLVLNRLATRDPLQALPGEFSTSGTLLSAPGTQGTIFPIP